MKEKPQLADRRYQLLLPIGSGANATVWKAKDEQTGAMVAIKVLRPDAMAADEIRRLEQEVKILQHLRHPNIVQVLGSGLAAGGSPFVVMEWVNGNDLRQRLFQLGQLPLGETVAIARAVCDALVEAHKHGIVHRDIKPENVLIAWSTPDKVGVQPRALASTCMTVKLVDFGTAKMLAREAPVLTVDGRILGTPHYMAPERALGQPVGGAADVYAVAVMTYEALMGRPPFDGGSPLQIIAAHLKGTPPPMTGLSPQLEHAVLSGLVKDPRHRPSAEQFAERLEQAVA